MENKFELLKAYVTNLGFEIASENPFEQIILITDEQKKINNLMIDCEGEILVFEQFIGVIFNESLDKYRRLMIINSEIMHGAFVLDESNNRLLFKDTLQLKNLDENEVAGTLISLSLAMNKYADELDLICR